MNQTPLFLAQNMCIQAQLKATLSLIEILAQKGHLNELTGDALKANYSRLCDAHQRELLTALEEKNPSMAAQILEVLDNSRTNGTQLF